MYFLELIYFADFQSMKNFEDISEMLSHGNFQDQHSPSEQPMRAGLNLQPSVNQIHFQGQQQIFENASNLSQRNSGQRFPQFDNRNLDIEEFFPCVGNDSQNDDESPRRNSPSSPNPQSRNSTGDQAQNGQSHDKKDAKNYKKNILGYITKKSIVIMLKYYRKVLQKKCKELDIPFIQFNKYYKNFRIYGPHSLVKLFKVDKSDPINVKMKALFNSVLTKIIRKRYLLYSIKLGKMQHIETYIRQKNTHLLYFADQLQNAMKNSGV